MERDPANFRVGWAVDGARGLRSAEGQSAVADGRGLNAGQVPGALEKFLSKTVALLQRRVSAGMQWDAEYEDVIRLETRIDPLQRDETADRQPGADDQHHRQR